MRALRILLIVVVVLAAIFVAGDRIAVNYAEGKAADELRDHEDLGEKPDVSIKGFPFLTQVAGGSLDHVTVGIDDYAATTSAVGGPGGKAETIHVRDLKADMRDVDFSSDFSSATAASADGSARISYPDMLKAAEVDSEDVAPGITAKAVKLSDGGDGKVKVDVEVTVLGSKLPEPISVMSTLEVKGDVVTAHAEGLPKLPEGLGEEQMRKITDYKQRIGDLPAGISIDRLTPVPDGVEIIIKGSHVDLAG
ncbi:DUF2993 domain-containing protein [Streptomyces sp. NPDC050560]|uniref:DUF2993 domain-containing protein n=1 Tax=Streptomyces sp. NPDC050560 TaxID=3365630 RepID=UPI00379B0799